MDSPQPHSDKPAAPSSGNLGLRIVSALILAPIALWCVWAGDLWFVILIAIVATAGGGEWRRISGLDGRGVGPVLVIGPLFVVLAAEAMVPAAGLVAMAVAMLVAAAAFGMPWQQRRWAVLGLFHVSVGAVAMLLLRQWPDVGRDLVFFLLAAVWLSDIGGYVVGRIIGGAKLVPRISPGKTWAGAVGSLGFSAVGGALFALFTGVEVVSAVWVAGGLSVAAQIGDLFESWIKRQFGVKDSGASIPGHGGVLDRVDGVLLAAPTFAVIVMLTGVEFVQWQ